MSRPIHFEIQADDLERAKAFYADVFGWTYEDYSAVLGSPYWGVTTGDADQPGINGGMHAADRHRHRAREPAPTAAS